MPDLDAALAWAARCPAAAGRLGRFQLEAAIQSVLAKRATHGRVDWRALLQFHDAMLRLFPSLGALVSRVAVLAQFHQRRGRLPAVVAFLHHRQGGLSGRRGNPGVSPGPDPP